MTLDEKDIYIKEDIQKIELTNDLLNYLLSFGESERDIALYLHPKRNMFPDIKKQYGNIKSFLLVLFTKLGCRKFYNSYLHIEEIRPLYLKSVNELIDRFAILKMANIKVIDALNNPIVLYAYSEEKLYKIVKYLIDNKGTITINDVIECINDENMVIEDKESAIFEIDCLSKSYRKTFTIGGNVE